MANNRKQPFGYRMEFGAYIPQPAEAEKVRWIYQTYLAGPPIRNWWRHSKSGELPMTGASRGAKIW